MSRSTLPAAIALGLAAVAGFALWTASTPAPLLVQGEVEAARIDVVPRASGRITALHAEEGDRIDAGAPLAELDSPQLLAALAVAEAAVTTATADYNRIIAIRPEVITAREAALAKAQADLDLAQQTHDRVAALSQRDVASGSQLDAARNALDAAQAGVDAASAELHLARTGASPEDRAVAAAQIAQAEASVARARADVAELSVTAPASGEVVSRIAEPGAMANAGAPILSIIDVDNLWTVFSLREDLLDGLAIGDVLTASVPALGGRQIRLSVTTIGALGSYANWRATRATGDFDLRTFQIRARPAEPVPGLRAGMSVILDWRR